MRTCLECVWGGLGRILRWVTLSAWVVQLFLQISGESALSLASEMGHVAVVEALVDAGADVNVARVRSLDTPMILHGPCFRMCLPHAGWFGGSWCVDTRCCTCVGLLCGAGAGQADGWTPIMSASRDGHLAVVAALVSRGANVSARTVRS